MLCTACRQPLLQGFQELTCTACEASLPLIEGIPSFTENHEYFFGEISRESMRQLAASVAAEGWDTAFAETCSRQSTAMNQYLRQYIADASRGNWKYLLDFPEPSTVLDFGCGWGETTLALSRSASHVVSMDLTFERLLLLRARSVDCGANNVTFAHGGDTLPLPFADDSFDAVVMNGVLEWVPVTKTGDPRRSQLEILREFRRILKPSGQLYVGIENRVGLRYFAGKIDEHSQMKYTSLMPRTVANLWSRLRRGQPYRTYTYSRAGYTRLMREAGFESLKFYCPYPDYREFERVVPVVTEETTRLFQPSARWKQMLLKTPGMPTLLQWSLSSFSIVASDKPSASSLLMRVVEQVSAEIDLDLRTPSSYHSKPIGEIAAFCAIGNEQAPSVLLRIAETPAAIKARLASAYHLETLWNDRADSGLAMQVIPRSLGQGTLSNGAYTAEEIKPGAIWQKSPSARVQPGKALIAVARWLVKFQTATKSGESWDRDELRMHGQALDTRAQSLVADLPAKSTPWDWSSPLDDIGNVPVLISHGDLHLGNALFAEPGVSLSGIVDWDLGSMRGLPLTDLVYLLLMYGMEVRGRSYAEAVKTIIQRQNLSEVERTVITDYQSAFNITDAYGRYATKVAILQNIVSLSDRRPEGFSKLLGQFQDLPAWILSRS